MLAGAFSGFLLVAPVVASGLYAVSRGLERGEQPALADVRRPWLSLDRCLVALGVLLALAGTGCADLGVDGHRLRPQRLAGLPAPGAARPLVAVRSLAVGALLAAPMFASSVAAIPLLVDNPRASARGRRC
ncbi:MAG: DUF2189 domain-containing protein [Rubrivivax sp.]